MKTLTLFAMVLIAIPPSMIDAQEMKPDWSINLHASPYLFEGQIEINDGSWVHNYSFDTFIGVDLTRRLGEVFDASISFGYTKARADVAPTVAFQSAESSIPLNSFLTESYNSCLKLSFLPASSGIFHPFISTGFGLAYFTHESKMAILTFPVTASYVTQHTFVPFIPAEAGMLFDIYQIGNFRLGFDASVLAMFSLRKNVYLDNAGMMTQPISMGIITGVSVGW